MIVNDPFLGVTVCQSSTLIQQQKIQIANN